MAFSLTQVFLDNSRRFRRSLILLGLLSSLLIPQLVNAETSELDTLPDYYQIEYVIFKHLDTDLSTLRFEDHSPRIFKEKAYTQLAMHYTPLASTQKKHLPLEQMRLGNALNRLKTSRATEVLSVGAWAQEIDNDTTLLPVKIAQDLSTESELLSLEGEVTIKRSRYLHAKFDLALTSYWPVAYEDIKLWFFDPYGSSITALLLPLHEDEWGLSVNGYQELPFSSIKVNESRRIKDEEIHYIDHPLLGIIVTIQKIPHPDTALLNPIEDDAIALP